MSGHDKSGDRIPSVTDGESEGVRQDDVWDISRVPPVKQIYVTQKPLKLLTRIITASSNEGDIVLDPFCGCATACVAAEEAKRRWVGIDISSKAAELVQLRMTADLSLYTFKVIHREDIPKRDDLGDLPPYRTHKPKLYGIQGGYCAEYFKPRHYEVDHIIARNKGGTDHIDNLQLLCGSCNRIKGDRGMEYLRAKLQLNCHAVSRP